MAFSNFDRNCTRKDAFYKGESDDVEDDTFLRHSPSGNFGYMLSKNKYSGNDRNYPDALEEKRQELMRRRKEIEEQSVSSTERSLKYLNDSEEVGIAAAEELLRQREQLERTEGSLDNINTALRFSQKHIQGIKSVFECLKNFFSGKPNETLPELKAPESFVRSPLNGHLNEVKAADRTNDRMDNHVGLRLKGQLFEDELSSDSQEHRARISKNLDNMLGSVYKLKGLAHGLGDEIESHNQLIDNVISKTEKADETIERQNKDINKMLK